MEYITTVNDKQYQIRTDQVLTPQQQQAYVLQSLGLASSQNRPMTSLSPATCPSSVIQGYTAVLNGSATGTAPFTYNWRITKPDSTIVTLSGQTLTYAFTDVGTYTVQLTVTDSCPSGPQTSAPDSCVVNVTATCPAVSCTFTMTQA